MVSVYAYNTGPDIDASASIDVAVGPHAYAFWGDEGASGGSLFVRALHAQYRLVKRVDPTAHRYRAPENMNILPLTRGYQ